MRQIYVVIYCCLSFTLLGQSKIDSLKHLAKTAAEAGNSEALANHYGQIAWIFLGRTSYDSATTYYYKSLYSSRDDKQLVASNLNALGIIYNSKGLNDSSIVNYTRALQIYNTQSDTINSSIIEGNLAIIYKNQGLYEKALQIAFSALEKLEYLKPDRSLASAYNTVGNVYVKLEDFDRAIEFYHKALRVRKDIGFDRGVAQSFNNIGETYVAMGRYDSALMHLKRATEMRRSLDDKRGMGSSMNLIGLVLLRQERFIEAETYLIESVQIKRESGERFDEANTLNNLAEVKLKKGQLLQAAGYLREAEFIIRQIHALDQLKRNLEIKVMLCKAQQNPVQALVAMEELLLVKDSLLSKDMAESLYTMQLRYETDKKEQQIGLLEKEKELQNSELRSNAIWIWSLIISILLLAVIVILVFLTFSTTKKAKHKVEILLKEMHHRVKNNLQLLTSIFSLHSQELTDEKAIQAVRSSEARINAMALIHRKLYNVDQNRTINIGDYISELIQYLVHAYGFNERPLEISKTLKSVQLDVDKAIPLGLVMNELISNSFKYAYDDQLTPQLSVGLDTADGQLRINVKDNGKGIDETKLVESESFGLKMIATFVKQLKGSMEIETRGGTEYILIIPMQ
jgi:two-component sensor histidine kinase/Tfp pilus assembly protein PilF